MIISAINQIKESYPYPWLLNTFDEPLFLKPDGIRTRYPIGWNGYGRYMPGTLKVTYNGLPCNITEEDNGVFYNFAIAPGSNTNYNDYVVEYMVRPIDYAFSTGDPLGGYPNEEYFLFPNWNNFNPTLNYNKVHAFWIGKYPASNDGNDIPVTIPNSTSYWDEITFINAGTIAATKSTRSHLITNREFASIALWTDHMNINVRGNIYGKQTVDLDGNNTNLSDVGGYYTKQGFNFVTGPGPDSWNHNGLSTGIHHLVGNIGEYVTGIYITKNSSTKKMELWITDENGVDMINTGIEYNGYTENTDIAKTINGIINTDEVIFNEALSINSEMPYDVYQPSNLNNVIMINPAAVSGMTFLLRGSSCTVAETYNRNINIWTIDYDANLYYSNIDSGFRIVFDLVD